MRKQYIIGGLILIMLYLFFSIGRIYYNSYKITANENFLKESIEKTTKENNLKKEEIEYLSTISYKEMVRKTNGERMNGEKIIILTNQDVYDRFSGTEIANPSSEIYNTLNQGQISTNESYIQRWIDFVFEKNI